MTYDITLLDAAFAFLMAVVQPIRGWFANKEFKRELAAGKPGLLKQTYKETMGILWLATVILCAAWLLADRPLGDLGLMFDGSLANWLGVGFVGVVLIYFAGHVRKIKSSAEEAQGIIDQFNAEPDVAKVLPVTGEEYTLYRGLSVTAGITEEILYRGFLIWFFAAVMPLWAAAALSVVIFMLGHLYQGSVKAVAQVGMIGIVVTLVYLLSGSLVPAILFHILVDLGVGAMVWNARKTAAVPA